MNIKQLFIKDLSTFSKSDLITLARYYKIPFKKDIVKSLADKQCEMYHISNMFSDKDVLNAVKNNDLIKVDELIKAGANVNKYYKYRYGRTTLLLKAIKSENLEMVKLLINAGADLYKYEDDDDDEGHIPLTLAIYNENLDIIKELILAGVNVNKSSAGYDSKIPLIIAIDNLEIVELLLNAGANPDIQDAQGMTALIHASSENYLEIVKLLIKYGANPNIKDNYGETAIDYASSEDYGSEDDILELLKDYKMELGFKATQKYLSGEMYSYFPEGISIKDLENYDNEKLIDLAKNLGIDYKDKPKQELVNEIWIKNKHGKANPRKLELLRDKMCKDLNNDFNLLELGGMAKALGFNYENKTKTELCASIATKLFVEKGLKQKLGHGDYKG